MLVLPISRQGVSVIRVHLGSRNINMISNKDKEGLSIVSTPDIKNGHIMKTWYITQNIKLQFAKLALDQNENYHLELLEEVPCGEDDRCRCDLAGVLYQASIPDATIGIEVKISETDFNSNCGLNFEFDYNYVAVPSELVGFAIRELREKQRQYVGILEITDNGQLYFVIDAEQNINKQHQSKTIRGYNVSTLDMHKFLYSAKKVF